MNAPAPLALEWVCTIAVLIGPRRALGDGPLGERFIVDLLGGTVEGPALSGVVLPGGQDRQLLRADGIKELDARYEIQATDGAIISVRNRALVDESAPGGRTVRSWLQMHAAPGPHAWLNRVVLVSRVDSLRPQSDAVRVTAYAIR